jgi:hypothetical protein
VALLQLVHHLLGGEISDPLDLELLLHQPPIIRLMWLLPEPSLEVELKG